jgi:uncharacterized membrane protein
MTLVDIIWLYNRKSYHDDLIKQIQGSVPNLRVVPAILIYLLIPLSVLIFAIIPSTKIESATLKGLFLGFCIYGVYDLTNYASLDGWTLSMTLTDMLWGTFLCGLGATFGYYLSSSVFRNEKSILKNISNFKYRYPDFSL